MEKAITAMREIEVVILASLAPRRVERRRIPFQAGETAESVVERAFPGMGMTDFAVDCSRVPGKTALGPGARMVAAWIVPSAGMTVAGLATMLMVGVALAMVSSFVSAIFTKKTKTKYDKQVEDVSDTQYGWDYNSRNAEQEGAPVPVLYGRRMVIPPVVQQRTWNKLDTGAGYAELVYAVADGGGGFNDEVTFPEDGDGRIQALLDHTSWYNYNSESMSGDDQTTNVVSGNASVFGNATFDGSQITGTSTVPSGLSSSYLGNGSAFTSQEMTYSLQFFPLSSGVNNVIFQASSASIPTRCVVKSSYAAGQHQGIKSFKLYGWYDTGWEEIGESSVVSGTTSLTATLNINGTPNEHSYRVFKLGNFSWKRKQVDRVGNQNIQEVELYVKTASGGTIPGGYCAVNVNGGTYDQTASTLTSQTWASLSVSKKMDKNYFMFSTSRGASPNRLNVHMEFPYGLYVINSQTGVYGANPIGVEMQYRAVQADGTVGGWTNYFNSSHRASDISVSGAKATISRVSQDSIKLDFEISGLSGADHYDIQARISSSPVPTVTDMSQCELHWTGVDEGWSFTCDYPRTATATLKMLASESLSGQVPQFKILAERSTVNVWDSTRSEGSEWQPKSANNPAWAAWDLVVHPRFDDRGKSSEQNPTTVNSPGVLLSEQFPHSRMIYSEFKAWADFCDSKSITCSMYYDSQTDVQSALGYLCDIGRAALVNRGGTIGVAIDCASDAVFAFDDASVVANSMTTTWRDVRDNPDEVEVTYFDKDREYNRFTLSKGTVVDGGRQPKTESVTLYACDSRSVADAHADYILGRNLIRKNYQWTGGEDAMPCDIGDVVWLYGDRCRITSATYDSEHRRVFGGEQYVPERYGDPERSLMLFTVHSNGGSGLAMVRIEGGPYKCQLDDGEWESPSPVSGQWIKDNLPIGDHTIGVKGEYASSIVLMFTLNLSCTNIMYMDVKDCRDISFIGNFGNIVGDLRLPVCKSIGSANNPGFSLFSDMIAPTIFCPAVENADMLFYNLINLQYLPDGFALPRARTAACAFMGCTSLVGLPSGFCVGKGCDVQAMFYGCTSLGADGWTPASEDWWENPDIGAHAECFRGCTSLSNYASIPSGWK